nr:reverse transcriptase domain, reverse transcriptase zinc-binding domain protein [Tanacetum cinerariifolium]
MCLETARAGFSLASKVCECIHGGIWSWSTDWMVKYPILNSIPVPVLNDAKSDVLKWRNSDGTSNPFSVQLVWDSIRSRDNEVPWSFKSCVGKLTLAAATYFVWQERNFRLFKNSKRSIQEVVDCVMSSVRLKLLSCRFKKSKDAVMFSRLWELPLSMLK